MQRTYKIDADCLRSEFKMTSGKMLARQLAIGLQPDLQVAKCLLATMHLYKVSRHYNTPEHKL